MTSRASTISSVQCDPNCLQAWSRASFNFNSSSALRQMAPALPSASEGSRKAIHWSSVSSLFLWVTDSAHIAPADMTPATEQPLVFGSVTQPLSAAIRNKFGKSFFCIFLGLPKLLGVDAFVVGDYSESNGRRVESFFVGLVSKTDNF